MQPASAPVTQPVYREPWRAIFLAVLLGLLAGFVHGWNLSLAALLILVVFFNVRARLFFAIWFLGVALSWLLVPMSYAVGRFVLDRTPVGEFFGLLGDTPVVSLFGWDRYTVAGGAIVAGLLAIPAFFTVRNWLVRLRSRGAETTAEPQRQSISNRFARWLLITDERKDDSGHELVVRPLGLWAAIVGTGAISMFCWWIVPKRAEVALISALADINGAAVTTGELKLDLWAGVLEIENLSLVRPGQPTDQWLNVQRIAAKLDSTALLQGRLNIEQLDIEGFDCDTAHVELLTDRSGEYLAGAEKSTAVDGVPTPSVTVAPESVVKEWPQIAERIGRLQTLLHVLERGQAIDEALRAGVRSRNWFAMQYLTEARSSFGLRRPTYFAGSIKVNGLPDDWGVSRRAALRLVDVTSNALYSPRPTRVEFSDPVQGVSLTAVTNLRETPYRHNVEFRVDDIALIDHVVPASSTQRLVCESGRAQLRGSGWVGQEECNVQAELSVKQLTAQLTGQAPLATIEVDTWNEALEAIDGLKLVTHVSGALTAPAVHIDTVELRRDIDHRLRSLGASRLAGVFRVPGDMTQPTARIVATRAQPSEQQQTTTYGEESQQSGTALRVSDNRADSHGRATASLPPVPSNTARVQRLPKVSANAARMADSESMVTITFTAPVRTSSGALVCDVPQTAPAPTVADPFASHQLAREDLQTIQRPIPWDAEPDHNRMMPADLYDLAPESEERSVVGRWTDETVARLSSLFKVKDRDPVGRADDNLHDELLEERLGDSRNGSRFGSGNTRTTDSNRVRLVR